MLGNLLRFDRGGVLFCEVDIAQDKVNQHQVVLTKFRAQFIINFLYHLGALGTDDFLDAILGSHVANDAARQRTDDSILIAVLPLDVHLDNLVGVNGIDDRGIYIDLLSIPGAGANGVVSLHIPFIRRHRHGIRLA